MAIKKSIKKLKRDRVKQRVEHQKRLDSLSRQKDKVKQRRFISKEQEELTDG